MSLKDLEAAVKKSQRELAAKQQAAAAPAEPAFTLQPCFDFYDHVRKEPREVLEARYRALIGLEPPKEARHEWLARRLAYHFQIKYYQGTTGAVPVSVARRAVEVALEFSGAPPGKAFDADDPRDEVELWDDSFVVAAVPNPYARGDARRAFLAVEMRGEAGIGFTELSKELEVALETSVGGAQEKALDLFTKAVRAGLMKIRITVDAAAG